MIYNLINRHITTNYSNKYSNPTDDPIAYQFLSWDIFGADIINNNRQNIGQGHSCYTPSQVNEHAYMLKLQRNKKNDQKENYSYKNQFILFIGKFLILDIVVFDVIYARKNLQGVWDAENYTIQHYGEPEIKYINW